jgi:hypothetical protein
MLPGIVVLDSLLGLAAWGGLAVDFCCGSASRVDPVSVRISASVEEASLLIDDASDCNVLDALGCSPMRLGLFS